MPFKGRSQPCDNPLKVGHSKQRQFKDVAALSTHTLEVYRDTLPEYNWRNGTRLCFQCRALASKKAKSREDDLRGVQILAAQGLERAQDLQGKRIVKLFVQLS